MTLPKSLGRALAGAGTGSGLTARALGENLGVETYSLLSSDLPAHKHNAPAAGQFATGGVAGAIQINAGANASLQNETGDNVTAHNPVSLMQPTSFMNVFIKL